MAYQHSRKVTIRNFRVLGTHTNFPVLFWGYPDTPDFNSQHRYPWLKSVSNGGKVYSETGIDIIFSLDPYGSRILPFERVAYDPVTGLVEFYIRLPLISVSDDVSNVYYVLYGDPDAPDRSNRTGVWDDTFVGVYHWGDGVTLDCSDSTHYGNHGTPQDTPVAAPGMVGTATYGFPTGGSLGCMGAGYVRVPSPDNASFDFNDGMTFEYSIFNNPNSPHEPLAVANGDILNKFRDLIEDPLHGGDGFKIVVNDDFQSGLPIQYFFDGIQSVPPFAAFFGTGESNVIFVENVARYDQVTGQLMLQGHIDVNGSPSTAFGTVERTNAPLFIGAGTDGFGNAAHRWPGWIDEVRLSNQPRAIEWTATTANNIGDPGHQFFFVGPEVQLGNTQPQVFVIT